MVSSTHTPPLLMIGVHRIIPVEQMWNSDQQWFLQ